MSGVALGETRIFGEVGRIPSNERSTSNLLKD
jgi:hypothetical protein